MQDKFNLRKIMELNMKHVLNIFLLAVFTLETAADSVWAVSESKNNIVLSEILSGGTA